MYPFAISLENMSQFAYDEVNDDDDDDDDDEMGQYGCFFVNS